MACIWCRDYCPWSDIGNASNGLSILGEETMDTVIVIVAFIGMVGMGILGSSIVMRRDK